MLLLYLTTRKLGVTGTFRQPKIVRPFVTSIHYECVYITPDGPATETRYGKGFSESL